VKKEFREERLNDRQNKMERKRMEREEERGGVGRERDTNDEDDFDVSTETANKEGKQSSRIRQLMQRKAQLNDLSIVSQTGPQKGGDISLFCDTLKGHNMRSAT
jgi:hypothetical protein